MPKTAKTHSKRTKSAATSARRPVKAGAAAGKSRKVVERTAASVLPSDSAMDNLHKWNVWLTVLFVLQGAAILILSASRVLPVIGNYLATDPLLTKGAGHAVLVPATHQLFTINLAYLVAIFLFLPAVAHFLMATVYRPRYEANLARGINKARWLEYALSGGTMMVVIGLLVGAYGIATLLMLFCLAVVMNLLGLAMEVYNQGKRAPNWLACGIGCVAGILPWIVIALYLIFGGIFGNRAPGFVYGIFGSIFILSACSAANLWVHYRGKGKWADYLYGEQAYMVLSLVAKSALAWQIFAGTLHP